MWESAGAAAGVTTLIGVIMLTALRYLFVPRSEFEKHKDDCQNEICQKLDGISTSVSDVTKAVNTIKERDAEENKNLAINMERIAGALDIELKEI